MVPFESMPAVAHTMLSFELARPDGKSDHLAVSVEVRKEKHETYNPVKGSARQYELMYVVADERDVIRQRTNYRHENVYLYRTTATPEVSQQLLADVLGRVNQLAKKPEFYDTLTNNCTTNIVRHIDRVRPNRVTYDVRDDAARLLRPDRVTTRLDRSARHVRARRASGPTSIRWPSATATAPTFRSSFADDFHQHALLPPPVELAVEDLLPGPEVELSVR